MQPQQSIWTLHDGMSRKIVIENIKKYIEAYDESWIVVHEALQNAIDAIQRSDTPNGKIVLELSLKEEQVRILDNGRGFPPNKELLCPGITDKGGSGATKGYQGVGLKALMYSTNYFEIASVYEQSRWDFMAGELYTLLQGGEPVYEEEVTEVSPGTSSGTQIKYSFPKAIVSNVLSQLIEEFYSPRTSDNRWLELYRHVENEQERRRLQISHIIKWYFQTYTYAGCCNRLLGVRVRPDLSSNQTVPVKPISIELVINAKDALDKCHSWLRDYLSQVEGNTITITFENKQWDFEEQIDFLRQQPKKYRLQAPDIESFSLVDDSWKQYKERYKDRVYVRKLLPDETKIEFSERYAEFLSLVKTRGRRSDDLQAKYEKLFRKILGVYLVIGRTSVFEKFGGLNHGERFIAANGIPTTHEITVRTTSSTWYLETIHFIVNVDERLNYGKKQIANTHTIAAIRDYFNDAYTVLMIVAKQFVRDVRTDESSEITTDLINLPDLGLDGVSIVKEPTDENTLIALFFQLLNYFDNDLQFYGLEGKGIYDGKFRWNSEQKPLADDHLKKIEFKIKLDKLVEDFENAHNPKEFRETDLIVVWDDELEANGWRVIGIDEQKRRELRSKGVPDYIDGALQESSDMYRPLICVKDLVEEFKKGPR